jgi:hypothetical protein
MTPITSCTLSFQHHGAADDVRRPAEAPLPQAVADDDDFRALGVFVRGEDAPELRLRAQHAPEVRGDLAGGQFLRIAVV